MSTFDLYIHGTPNGHQIWGSDKNHDYISTFYNHDMDRTDNPAMQIDICMGDSYYTYIRQQNVYDSNERPGAFFAITVCFTKAYCTNVYKLYQIFEAVYNQVCIGSLISQKQGKEIYLVSDFESSRSGNSTTVDRIRAIFVKNIGELIEPYLITFENVGDTFNKTKKQFSLQDVDSPLFFDFLKKQSIIVLPNLEPASITNQTITKQLNVVNAQKNALETANAKLQSDNVALTNENKNLSNQLYSSASSSEKKYSSTINQLKADLKAASQERDELKAKIEEAKSSVDIIDKPVQQLTRLLAGRFPEGNRSRMEKTDEISQKTSSKNSSKVRLAGLNSILLCIIIVLCAIILYFVVFKINVKITNTEENPIEQVRGTIDSESIEYDISGSNNISSNSESGEKSDIGPSATEDDYNWNDCVINIVGGGSTVKKNKQYTLKIQKKGWRDDNSIPQGSWYVAIEPNSPINNKDTFKISLDTQVGKNVMVKYMFENKPVVTKVTKVVK